MSSKMERWKKLSGSSKESPVNPNKTQILTDLSTTDVKEGSETGEGENLIPNPSSESENMNNNSTNDSSVDSRNNPSTLNIGVQEMEKPLGEQPSNDQGEKKKRERAIKPQESLITKVNDNVRSFIENKVTKEDTHKKTSFLLTLSNLAKLENFDKAHGGRIKGEFLNNLLEEAFAELEKDPQWKSVLNANLDNLMAQIAKKR